MLVRPQQELELYLCGDGRPVEGLSKGVTSRCFKKASGCCVGTERKLFPGKGDG